ncbi:MAG TPA: sodium:proton antiporter [Chitinophagaceae bacterium]|nr:sodium:proton antiporter [Chitinophagaceae bacterium]
MSTDFYSILTILVVLTAVFSYINYRFIRLPATIGIMLIALLASLCIVIIGSFYPLLLRHFTGVVKSIDFEDVLMRVMLSFLLFAGALHVDIHKLRKEIIPIISFSTIGVLISTACIGVIVYLLFKVFSFNIPFIYCLLFGALISPTDPIAVLGILRKAKISASLETKIVGESLFNDGVGIVVFITIFEIARLGPGNVPFLQIAWLFLKEAGGGVVWGIVLGYAGFYLLRSIDQYQVEVLITLAMVMGGYLLATSFHVSGPLAMVVAGIITGNIGMAKAMSVTTRDYLKKFWELIDEILNAVLFILIGFEMLIISIKGNLLWICFTAPLVILFARWLSVSIPILLLSFKRTFEKNSIAILTWGGLRGGISVALAFSLPAYMHREEFLSITYVVVIFSIVVQGLTIGKMARKFAKT